MPVWAKYFLSSAVFSRQNFFITIYAYFTSLTWKIQVTCSCLGVIFDEILLGCLVFPYYSLFFLGKYDFYGVCQENIFNNFFVGVWGGREKKNMKEGRDFKALFLSCLDPVKNRRLSPSKLLVIFLAFIRKCLFRNRITVKLGQSYF